jgi:N-ethylmaleimide reductase
LCKTFRPFFKGIIIANDSFNSARGLEFIRNEWADMVSFGRLYINNPDLAERLIKNL